MTLILRTKRALFWGVKNLLVRWDPLFFQHRERETQRYTEFFATDCTDFTDVRIKRLRRDGTEHPPLALWLIFRIFNTEKPRHWDTEYMTWFTDAKIKRLRRDDAESETLRVLTLISLTKRALFWGTKNLPVRWHTPLFQHRERETPRNTEFFLTLITQISKIQI